MSWVAGRRAVHRFLGGTTILVRNLQIPLETCTVWDTQSARMVRQSHSFDGYTAIDRIASGPMTALYCASQQLVGRKVVIKTLSSGILQDSAFGQNIEREASILA